MTKQQAISILEQVTAELKLSLKDHTIVRQALEVLAKEPKPVEKEKPSEEV